MKYYTYKLPLFFFFLHFIFLNGQTSQNIVHINELPIINLTKNVSLHFISPEPVQFVDLSTNYLVGDLPTEQITRVKINTNSGSAISITDSVNTYQATANKVFTNGEYLGVITIVGQSFMSQYKIIYSSGPGNGVVTNIKINAEDMQPLEFNKMNLSNAELEMFSKRIEKQSIKKPIRTTKDMKLKMHLNNVYVIDDYIFIDLSINNKTNLSYDIEDLKFSIEDKKIYKATNNQSVILKPLYVHNKTNRFNRNYRNIFVFKKVTMPNSKVFLIRLIENQISGRTIELKIKYSDILKADTL